MCEEKIRRVSIKWCFSFCRTRLQSLCGQQGLTQCSVDSFSCDSSSLRGFSLLFSFGFCCSSCSVQPSIKPESSADVWLLVSLCFSVAGHSPCSYPVQAQTLKFSYQIQTEQVGSSCLRGQESGAWRICGVAVVGVGLGMRSRWDTALLQQPQESQWWCTSLCRGGADGVDVRTSVLVVGWWRRPQELTVPTRWQAVRAKPVKSGKRKGA